MTSHQSGYLYVWDSEQTSRTTGQQHFISHTETQDAVINIVKPKNKGPILYRWAVGHGAINAFSFSPDSIHIAIASQDGFTRVYDFHKHVIYSRVRSYFGGFLCVCWSPDGKYLATGGEDDLITVWSFEHKKVVSRGEGHKSYVSAVAFDPYTTVLPDSDDSSEDEKSDKATALTSQSVTSLGRSLTELGATERNVAYRLGSVGQDTQLCLWDLSGDALKLRRPFARTRSRVASRHAGHQSQSEAAVTSSSVPAAETVEGTSPPNTVQQNDTEAISNHVDGTNSSDTKRHSQIDENGDKESTSLIFLQTSEKTSNKKDIKKKRHKDKDKSEESDKVRKGVHWKDPMKKVLQFVGVTSPSHNVLSRRCQVFEPCNSDDIASRMDEVNLIEPLVAKKISQERITCLIFREDCIVTATQEGLISTWARPNTTLPLEAMDESKTSDTTAIPTNAGVSFMSATN